MLRKDADWAREKQKSGRLPLHVAIMCGAPLALVEAIIAAYERGPRRKDLDGAIPLHLALTQKSPPEISLTLLIHFPEGSKWHWYNYTPLAIALMNGAHHTVCSKLLELHPDAAFAKHIEEIPNNTILHLAAKYGAALETVREIIALYPAAIGIANDDEDLPVHVALQNRSSLQVAEYLLQCERSAGPHLTWPMQCKGGAHDDAFASLSETVFAIDGKKKRRDAVDQ